MIKGLYAAASGMVAQQARISAVANNLANISTNGYKRSVPVYKGFYEVFLEKVTQSTLSPESVPGGGVAVDGTYGDFSQGILALGQGPLDVAINGPGFFVVQTPSGPAYTRDGRIDVNTEGQLVSRDGLVLEGTTGPITITGQGEIQILKNGEVRENGASLGTLRMVNFAEGQLPILRRVGSNFLWAPPDVQPIEGRPQGTSISQFALEQSNIEVTREILEMMMAVRGFEANQRAIRAIDETLGRTISEISR